MCTPHINNLLLSKGKLHAINTSVSAYFNSLLSTQTKLNYEPGGAVGYDALLES